MNETYRMAKQCIDNAKAGVESSCVCFIRPANQGKTHTAQIIAIDEKAIVIPAMSVSEQKTWFAEKVETPYFILDDPSDWFNILDRQHVLSILKNLLSGYVKSARATKFDYNISVPIEKKVAILLFMTDSQYSNLRRDMELVGLSARTSVFLSRHTIEEFERIKTEYNLHKYSSSNLPKFYINSNTEFDDLFMRSATTKKYFSEQIQLEERTKKVKK